MVQLFIRDYSILKDSNADLVVIFWIVQNWPTNKNFIWAKTAINDYGKILEFKFPAVKSTLLS